MCGARSGSGLHMKAEISNRCISVPVGLGAISFSAQGLLVHEILLLMGSGPYTMLRVEPGSAVCKANAVSLAPKST